MKLNLSASELAESLKQKSNATFGNTKLSQLNDELDILVGKYLGFMDSVIQLPVVTQNELAEGRALSTKAMAIHQQIQDELARLND